MIVLGIESSTPVASAALVAEEGLVGEFTLNIGLTHSEQLMPLIDNLFQQTRVSLAEIGGIAVAQGPGSFTGLRIGMATAKGLAQGKNIPLIGVSTLQALAFTQESYKGLVTPVMNARKEEVYTALYRLGKNKMDMVLPEQAVNPQEWVKILNEYNENILFVGDGIIPYLDIWRTLGEKLLLSSPIARTCRANTVAWLGREKLLAGEITDLYGMKPVYIRQSEAQVKRDRLRKQG